MRAVITSVGETTTDICRWSLERNGFDVFVLMDPISTLWEKLRWIYNNIDENFLRVDADVIPNRMCIPKGVTFRPINSWWVQFTTFDWFKQELTHGGVQFIYKEALPTLRSNIDKFKEAERPESQMFRLEEFDNPRRCITNSQVMGLHGYGQKDIERVKETKRRRKYYDTYDWEMYDKLMEHERNLWRIEKV